MTSLDDLEEMTRKKKTVTTTTITSDVDAPSEISFASTERVIRKRPPKFLNELLDIEVLESSVARFNVRVTGPPLPTITWFIDNVEIHPGDRYTIQYDDLGHCSLTIQHVTRDDAGEVECRAVNPFGTTASFCDLIVRPIHQRPRKHRRQHHHVHEEVVIDRRMKRPKFDEPMEPQQVLVGETATITCRVTAMPPPVITWFKDGRTLVEDEHHITTYREDGTCILTITEVVPQDEAEYMCKAVNNIGKAVSYAELTVRISFDIPDYQREVSLLSTTIPEEDSWTETEYYVDRTFTSGKEIVETITTKTTKTVTRTISLEDRESASEAASVTVEVSPKPKPLRPDQVCACMSTKGCNCCAHSNIHEVYTS